MTRPTYKEQERHLHEEYIAGRVEPGRYQFCFCGSLIGERTRFKLGSQTIVQDIEKSWWPSKVYEYTDLKRMEAALFFYTERIPKELHEDYETALFNGMVAALEVLKAVHRSWGEDVDGLVEFERRGVTTSSFT